MRHLARQTLPSLAVSMVHRRETHAGHGAVNKKDVSDREHEPQPLSETVSNILEEARMILPGTQTLLGFQLMVVFNSRFQERLTLREQHIHLAATMLVAVATAMLVAPAAYHRWVEPEAVSRPFVLLATRLLRWSLLPLMLAICADVYLVAIAVTTRPDVSLLLALALLAVFVGLWYALPYWGRARRRDGSS